MEDVYFHIDNIALGKTVTTNPDNSNKQTIVGGNNAYKYVTQNSQVAGKYLDLTFQPDMQTDSNGYNYNESTYIMADANWTKVAEKKAGTTIHVNEFDLSDKMLARYIKLDDLKTPEVISFSLCEVEAYGMRIDDISLVKRYALAYLYKNPQIIFQ